MIKPPSRAYLVLVQTQRSSKRYFEDQREEVAQLTTAAAIKVLGSSEARVFSPSPSHFLRAGKLEEVRQKMKALKANLAIFNIDLSPAQARNIEKTLGIRPMDRTGLILEIFGRRAKSKEGKLQVELARLQYILPRLGGLGLAMSRLGGGIGTRGPGEQELEWDRRKIRKRIQRVKTELKKVVKHRGIIRDNRRRKKLATVALVGYTNAGKSTLLNSLTGADAYVQDQLFATLDPKTRMQTINGRRDILFIDTVGFIRDLPHSLVEAFHATLEEVVLADILIHVLDVSDPHAQENKRVVEEVLKEIKAFDKHILLALNKADLMESSQKTLAQSFWPEGILVSAKKSLGFQSLFARLEASLPKSDARESNFDDLELTEDDR